MQKEECERMLIQILDQMELNVKMLKTVTKEAKFYVDTTKIEQAIVETYEVIEEKD